jgi:hypothetical protein
VEGDDHGVDLRASNQTVSPSTRKPAVTGGGSVTGATLRAGIDASVVVVVAEIPMVARQDRAFAAREDTYQRSRARVTRELMAFEVFRACDLD